MRILILLCIFLSFRIHASNFQVTRTDDPIPDGCLTNDCSLREAVISANNNPGLDSIFLATGIYALSRQGDDELAVVGDLDVTEDLIIEGNSKELSIIDAQSLSDRIFDIKINSNINISDLSLINATAFPQQGGAVLVSEASAQFNRVLIDSCEASNGAGVAALLSDVEFHQTTLINNQAKAEGGGIYLLDSTMIMHDSKVLDNLISGSGGKGGGINADFQFANQLSLVISINNSIIQGNVSTLYGGGIALFNSSMSPVEIEINNILVANNWTENWGGGLHLGQMIELKIMASTFSENSTGIANSFGGGIYLDSGILQIENSLFKNNSSGYMGGGIISNANGSEVDILNSTFSGNIADFYGAIKVYGSLNLKHVTVKNNTSIQSSDILFQLNATIGNSIISGDCDFANNGSFTSYGGNVESPGNTCGLGAGANDIVSLHPRLLGINTTLGNYGGPTETHIINTTYSPAIGNAIVIPTVTEDQRYFSRDAQPDSGATEQHPGGINLIFKGDFEQ